ncbi:hypothetical protein OIU79_027670 [Salix purpurea]|uniref:Uncharacterized protein n=1 Tax=Salix purpurea TaxID=77065 RepID=A0A9Q1A1R5_SALPP|nr:hypothetical protein OIU79_027670 [Salix purpurea]
MLFLFTFSSGVEGSKPFKGLLSGVYWLKATLDLIGFEWTILIQRKGSKDARNMKLYCCIDGPLMMAQYVIIRSNI